MNRILEEDALTIAQTPINWQNHLDCRSQRICPSAFCTRVYDEKQNV